MSQRSSGRASTCFVIYSSVVRAVIVMRQKNHTLRVAVLQCGACYISMNLSLPISLVICSKYFIPLLYTE